MNFQNDVFISFTHIDNQPITDRYEGWINRFHKTLRSLLNTKLGTEAKIWRDSGLNQGQVLSKEVIDQLQQSAIMLSIVSPRYLKSDWCTREVEAFCEHARQNGGLMVGSVQRLIPVLKTPVSGPLPAFMGDVLFHKFFEEKENGASKEYDEAFGEKYGIHFLEELNDLACSLKAALDVVRGEAPSGPPRPAVYLAECSPDRKLDRDMIGRELRKLGYPVLPEGQLPLKEKEYVAAVDGMLSRCALSIHLVGSVYGDIPDGPSGKSTPIHQNEIAVSHAKRSGLKRLIGLPTAIQSELPSQQAFITALRRDIDVQFGADLIAGDIEELKTAIHATLKRIEEPPPPPPPTEAVDNVPAEAEDSNAKAVYLIHDVRDRESKAVSPVRKLCRQLGLKVLTPAFDGDAAMIRKTKEDSLANCDLVLLFYGAGDEAWARAMDVELMRLPGYRKRRPLPKALTYVAGPATPDKQGLVDDDEPDLINGLDGLSEAALTKAIKDALANGRAAS